MRRWLPLLFLSGLLVVLVTAGPSADDSPLDRFRVGLAAPDVASLTHTSKAWHYRPYQVLDELAPRADYIFVSGRPQSRNERVEELIAIAGASSVRVATGQQQLDVADPDVASVVIRGRNDAGEWIVRVLDGPPPELMLVGRDPESPRTVLFLDQRLVSDGGDFSTASGAGLGWRPPGATLRVPEGSTAPMPVWEALLLLLLMGVGSALLSPIPIPAWVRPAAGLIAGTALVVVVGTASVVAGLPGSPLLVLFLTLGVALAALAGRAARGVRPARWWPRSVSGVLDAAPWAAAFLLLSVVTHLDGIIVQQRDGIEHVTRAAVLARGGSVELLYDFYTLNLRMVGLASVNSLASLWGADFLLALVPALALATLGLTAATIARFLSPTHGPIVANIAGIVGAVMVGTVPMFLYAAFSHLPHVPIAAVATLMLLTLTTGPSDRQAAGGGPLLIGHVLGLLAAALVLTKPDALFVAALILLGTGTAGRKAAVIAWRYVALSLIAWQSVMFRAVRMAGEAPSREFLALVGLGVLLLLAAGQLRRVPDRIYVVMTSAPVVAAVALVAVIAMSTERLDRSIAALSTNLLGAEGGWGWSLAALLVLASAVTALGRGEPRVVSSVVFGLPAIFLLLPLLADSTGAYRLGVSDSMNRMWVNILPFIVILVVVGAVRLFRYRRPESPDSGSGQERRRPLARASITVAIILVSVAAPRLSGSPMDPEVLAVVISPTSELVPVGEITSGVELEVELDFLTELAPVSPALHPGSLCMRLYSANYAGRPNVGSYLLTLRLGLRSDILVVDMSEEPDMEIVEHCFDGLRPVDLDRALREPVALSVTGLSGMRGSSSTLLFTPDAESARVTSSAGLAEPVLPGYVPYMEVVVVDHAVTRWPDVIDTLLRAALLVSALVGIERWRGVRSRERSTTES